MRDHEYKRHGTLTLMAGIDLLTGHVHALVKERHRSREFIEFLRLHTIWLAVLNPAALKISISWRQGQRAHWFHSDSDFIKGRAVLIT